MKVLFVCTGNTCRSPMAEGYLKSKNIPNLEVESYGIYAAGDAVSENALKVMAEIGVDISAHISRPLDSSVFSADKIYCMSDSHRKMLLSIGVSKEKVFVLSGGILDPFRGNLDEYRICRNSIVKAIDKLLSEGEFYGFKIENLDYTHISEIAKLEKFCFSEPWSENAIIESFKSGTVFLVAVNGKKVLGYLGIKPVLDEGYITNVAVFPEYRRMGVAKALITALDSLARDKQLSFISLEVRESNAPAISLYEGFGYKNEGIRKNFYRDPKENAIIMTKRFV